MAEHPDAGLWAHESRSGRRLCVVVKPSGAAWACEMVPGPGATTPRRAALPAERCLDFVRLLRAASAGEAGAWDAAADFVEDVLG